ncbi:MAG: carbon-nitrogen hydrolase family protein [Chloroflexi bacterium]|nr:carbon-nitrogen hydrolase family protein [Chloroflexota bacterium]
MKISVIQSRTYYDYNPSAPGDWTLEKITRAAQPGIEEGLAMAEKAAGDGAQLIVMIEAFNTTVLPNDLRFHYADIYEPLDGPIINRFSRIAKCFAAYIVAGLYTSREGKAYNSAVLFGPNGRIVGVYDKVHLPAGEDREITPGSSFPVFSTEYGSIGMLICWDMQYPEAPRELALGGADLIACPTWGWEHRFGLCRAYENGVTIAAAMGINPHGLYEDENPSCIVDNMGRVIAAAPRNEAAIVSAEVDIRQEPAPQYGADRWTGLHSMRQIRLLQRRPDAYRLVTLPHPPVMSRYPSVQGPASENGKDAK